MRYELDRAKVKMKLSAHNKELNDNIQLREVES